MSSLDYARGKKITASLTGRLESLRKRLGEWLANIKPLVEALDDGARKQTSQQIQTEFSEEIRNIYAYSTSQIVNILSSVFTFSKECLVQKAPCSFAVVALGSLHTEKY